MKSQHFILRIENVSWEGELFDEDEQFYYVAPVMYDDPVIGTVLTQDNFKKKQVLEVF